MIINIGRQLGSGGREIGEKLAAELNYAYYDKELIQIAAKESGIAPELFTKADENSQGKFPGAYWGMHLPYTNGLMPFSTGLDNDSLFRIQSDTIRNLAEQGNCVFVGRCADYILRERTDCLNIFISADPNMRIKRLMEYEENLNVRKATEIMETKDKERAEYYNFYSGKNWGRADSYHLCINSSLLGIDGTVRLLKTIVGKLVEG